MPIDLSINPMPHGGQFGYITSRDGVRLRYGLWQPAPLAPPRGTICVFTGRAEYIEKYHETISNLRQRGFVVCALDWRGQGGSDRLLKNPRKGHVQDWRDYGLDIDALMHHIVLPDCPPPYYGLAHSMGGLILLHTLPRLQTRFDRLVLSAPFLGLGTRYAPTNLSSTLARLLTGLGFSTAFVPGGGNTLSDWLPFAGNPFTHDLARFERNIAVTEAHPELGLGSPTLGWLANALRAMKEVRQSAYNAHNTVPVLMFIAGHDSIVSRPAIESLSQHLRHSACVVIDGAYHEILQEKDLFREQFWAGFDAFITNLTA